jgi:tetratricopeptide (TPR) repeat protein
MKRVGQRISIFFFYVLITAITASAQDRNSVTGFVFGPDRAPVQRLNIELQTELYSTVARTQTNGSGMYSFRGLPAGVYLVKVLTFGTDLEEQSRSVNLIPISALPGRGAVSEQLDFYLRNKVRRGDLQGPGGVVFAQEVPKDAQNLYLAGIADLENKKEADGYGKLKQSLEIFPDYFLALERLASEYLRKGYYDAALILFTNAVRVNPRSVSCGLGIGVAEFRLQQVNKALETMDAVLKLDKENVNAYYWKGIILHSQKKLSGAVAALLKADQFSNGKFADAHFQLARVYKDQNKFRESAEALEAYLKLRPDAENAAEIRQIIKTLRERPAS